MQHEIERYIENHIDPEPEQLKGIDRYSNLHLLNGRMCSGHIQGRLLKMLTAMVAPKSVLELGAYSGYSALSIAEGLPDGAVLHTVEVDDELEGHLRREFGRSPFTDKIILHIGDAMEVCRQFSDESFDMIFVDADKRSYCDYYTECLRLLRPGGFMIADNTLWDGHVVDPAHSRDAQTRGIMDFNDMVAADRKVEKVILPLRDGLTIIRKL